MVAIEYLQEKVSEGVLDQACNLKDDVYCGTHWE
jgi:hypothetical protein